MVVEQTWIAAITAWSDAVTKMFLCLLVCPDFATIDSGGESNHKQAGLELCQAQVKLGL